MTFRFAAFLPLALAGCAQPLALPDARGLTRAADPVATFAAPAGPAVAYSGYRITEPMDWRLLNDAQTQSHGEGH
jgi:hypothetical protein